MQENENQTLPLWEFLEINEVLMPYQGCADICEYLEKMAFTPYQTFSILS